MDAIDLMYEHYDNPTDNTPEWWLDDKGVTLDTKIKILDKPIILELPKINQNEYDTNSSYRSLVAYENRYKINEIIKHINEEEK